MTLWRHVLLIVAASALIPAVSSAQTEGAATHITAELVAPGPVPAGGEGLLAIHMTPQPGWHGYWLNPGDAGQGMTLNWTLPKDVITGAPRYPVPQTLLVSGLMNHVYEHAYAVMVPVRPSKNTAPGLRAIQVRAQWLACTETICVPERATLSASLTIAPAGSPAPVPSAIEQGWIQRLPAPLDRPATMALDAQALHLAIPLPASAPLAHPHVFVAADQVVDYAAPQHFARKGDMLTVTIPRAKFAPISPTSLDGVLRLDSDGNGIAFTAKPGTVPSGGTPLAGDTADVSPSPASIPALPWLLLAALLGGLILNVMPCVFPILSLKALSLARAGESEHHARIEGLAYSAGVIVACLILGAVLLGLRAAGQQVGWAFQLQEPWVVVLLFLLAATITANLLGLFEFAVPGFARAGSPQGAFATGLLAAFVATPCTGPFMASAMGAALLLPVPAAMALFAALGLGIALPFLALAFVPALRRRLPRPGGWMETFRKVMAVPMALTALALGWLVWRLGNSALLSYVAVLALLTLALLGLAGRNQRRGKSALSHTLIALAVVALAVATLPQTKAPAEAEASLLAAQPFSEAALAKATAAHKPVFVYMTADWCLSCKVNEAAAIERTETKAAFDKAGVVVLRGDWTRRDPAITRYLTAQGAAGVPLYMWYDRQGHARQLPQVLTPGLLAELAAG
ncbi:protein-disulfide reductase DsbD family protein [Novosphingobium sp. 9]|uniref:protein-disulfide reductase DsbD family protein n=1 Tax=Novosphingobium sp. 9 TaxID=2025349 RepID=UPI0021B6B037|nr:thioredoxin family protein [Novosphingobium sp. 9]